MTEANSLENQRGGLYNQKFGLQGKDLREDLAVILNHHSRENESNTPDFILAEFMVGCLKMFEGTTRRRERWYGKHLEIGGAVRPATHYADGSLVPDVQTKEGGE